MPRACIDRLRLSMGRSCPRSWAAISTCRTYRYRLVRVWDPNKPQLACIAFTGSDADDHRCIGFAGVSPAPRACGSKVLGALFNAWTANYTRSTEEPESDPDEGPIIPLGGAVTGLTRG